MFRFVVHPNTCSPQASEKNAYLCFVKHCAPLVSAVHMASAISPLFFVGRAAWGTKTALIAPGKSYLRRVFLYLKLEAEVIRSTCYHGWKIAPGPGCSGKKPSISSCHLQLTDEKKATFYQRGEHGDWQTSRCQFVLI